jgi:hypothetical protein
MAPGYIRHYTHLSAVCCILLVINAPLPLPPLPAVEIEALLRDRQDLAARLTEAEQHIAALSAAAAAADAGANTATGRGVSSTVGATSVAGTQDEADLLGGFGSPVVPDHPPATHHTDPMSPQQAMGHHASTSHAQPPVADQSAALAQLAEECSEAKAAAQQAVEAAEAAGKALVAKEAELAEACQVSRQSCEHTSLHLHARPSCQYFGRGCL